MERGPTGYYVPISSAGENCRAFIPHPLPPEPSLRLEGDLAHLHEQATLALGRLDGLAAILPDIRLFLYAYVRKEAVLSSQIEGTQSSLSDLLMFESDVMPGAPLDDVQEVSSYVAALNFGLERLKELPLSLRLLKEIHAVLLGRGRGSSKEPGEFRRSQNWIGGSRPGNAAFVPPPPDQLLNCLGALENFLHNRPVRMPLLVKAGLAHAQFETIHPFLDGNGRLGRLLITLLLCAEGALREPMLYLSLYLKQNRPRYYELLQSVRLTGDWEAWLQFFFTGVQETAEQAVATARSLLDLFAADREQIQSLGRAAGSALRVHQSLQKMALAPIATLAEQSSVSIVTATTALQNLERLGIAEEITGGRYGRLYAYRAYLKLLSEGTESPFR